jgi:hypothetical protein
VLEIVELEQPKGVIVQYGGQTPLKLARAGSQWRADDRHQPGLDRPPKTASASSSWSTSWA